MMQLITRQTLVLLLVGILGVAIALPSHAQRVNATRVSSLLTQYPEGGRELVTALAQLLLDDPSLACLCVRYASVGSDRLKTSVAAALASASVAFSEDSNSLAVIRRCVTEADATTQAAYYGSSGYSQGAPVAAVLYPTPGSGFGGGKPSSN